MAGVFARLLFFCRSIGFAVMDNIEVLREKLAKLRQEHRDLDDVILRMQKEGPFDQLQAARMKKRKLAVKDEISTIESRLIPDIIA